MPLSDRVKSLRRSGVRVALVVAIAAASVSNAPLESDAIATAPGAVEEIIVRGDPSQDLLGSIETRAQSDRLVNVLGAEDLAKFAVVDMADALKRVAGVNVVEGRGTGKVAKDEANFVRLLP